MGREIKRVPLNFGWPLDETWHGFLHSKAPNAKRYPKRAPRTCPRCDGTGYNRLTKKIADNFYALHLPWLSPEWRTARWCDRITQDEVDALIANGRLWDFWRRVGPNGWEDIKPRPRVTAEQVNEANRREGIASHDGFNRGILVETRARRLGVYGKCSRCNGSGTIFRRHTDRKRWERWQETPVPKGDGWQMWETVSEGSPVTPVFATAESLADFLVNVDGYSRKAADEFVRTGWAMSGMMVGGKMYANLEALAPGTNNDVDSKAAMRAHDDEAEPA